MIRFGLVLLVLLAVGVQTQGEAEVKPAALRCEYKENPAGIDVLAPRLSWILQSPEPGQRQTAYQILVADTPEALASDTGTLWDSGKVASDQTLHVVYSGEPLASRMQCYWKVRAWDATGAPSSWSEVARWSMGLLSPGDWSADWIGYDEPAAAQGAMASAEPQPSLAGSHWLWCGDETAIDATPVGSCYFARSFDMPSGQRVQSAQLLVTADNRCQVFLNGKDVNAGNPPINAFTRLHQIPVDLLLQPGENLIAVEAANEGDAPNPAGFIARLIVTFDDGEQMEVVTDESWMATTEGQGEDWPLETPSDWAGARVVARLGEGPWQEPKPEPALQLPPPPFLRKEFEARPSIQRATLYATALGLYEIHLNGERVDDQYFTPGWTDYDKRVYYNTYDVSGLVNAGKENALGAILADGWYAGYLGFRLLQNMDRPRNFYGGEPCLRLQLEIEYADGTTDRIVTDETWKAAYGPILEADLLMGETHDRRITLGEWSTPGYDDSSWQPVVTETQVKPVVQAHRGLAVRQFEEFPAQTVKELRPSVFIYDLGQNMVGWVRIKAKGAAGQRVQVRHAEMLQPDGGLYTVALRKARATDTYFLAGDAEEVLEPKFTFHGFRYVEISGLDSPPDPKDVVGVFLRTPIPQTGFFECSEPLLNQLFHNIVWGQRGNYLEIPTDCPQRDERLGWTGDAQFFMPTAAYIADVGAFFTKWLVDLVQDSQLPDGSWADVAPNVELGGGSVAWGDAAIICTYQMYQYYADTRIIEEHFDALVRGMDFLEQTSEGFIRTRLGYGDWLNLGGGAKDEVISTAYFAYLAGLMKEMAQVIARDEQAKKYAALEQQVKAAFATHFIREDGSIVDSSQTGYALAFTMDLIPEQLKHKAADHFVKEIERFDGHLATGFIGTPRLLPALSLADRPDTAYDLLMETSFPSWLYQVTLGATTMWERWDGWTPEQGFQDPGMNSFNHYAFGAVGEYLFKSVGGIQAAAPGFKEIRIAPKPGGGLTWAKTRYDSAHGPIRSEWTLTDETFTLEIEVPVNTRALVELPEGGAPLEIPDGVEMEPGPNGANHYRLGSGTHRFVSSSVR